MKEENGRIPVWVSVILISMLLGTCGTIFTMASFWAKDQMTAMKLLKEKVEAIINVEVALQLEIKRLKERVDTIETEQRNIKRIIQK